MPPFILQPRRPDDGSGFNQIHKRVDQTRRTLVRPRRMRKESAVNCVISKSHVHKHLEIKLLQNSLYGRLSRRRYSCDGGRPWVQIYIWREPGSCACETGRELRRAEILSEQDRIRSRRSQSQVLRAAGLASINFAAKLLLLRDRSSSSGAVVKCQKTI